VQRAKKTGRHIVYKATSPSGKIYIGKTHFRLQYRIELHFGEARRGTKRPFCFALRKYGQSIQWEILEDLATNEEASAKEKYYIKTLNTKDRSVGYNLTDGGEGTPGLEAISRRIYIIDNYGNLYLGYKQIESKLGFDKNTVMGSTKRGYWCGKYYFSVYKDGMVTAEPRVSGSKLDHRRKVYSPQLDFVFFSMKDAAEFLGVMQQSVYRVCAGTRNSVKGHNLKYWEGI
jgi:GIY-YIG catalytic domain